MRKYSLILVLFVLFFTGNAFAAPVQYLSLAQIEGIFSRQYSHPNGERPISEIKQELGTPWREVEGDSLAWDFPQHALLITMGVHGTKAELMSVAEYFDNQAEWAKRNQSILAEVEKKYGNPYYIMCSPNGNVSVRSWSVGGRGFWITNGPDGTYMSYLLSKGVQPYYITYQYGRIGGLIDLAPRSKWVCTKCGIKIDVISQVTDPTIDYGKPPYITTLGRLCIPPNPPNSGWDHALVERK